MMSFISFSTLFAVFLSLAIPICAQNDDDGIWIDFETPKEEFIVEIPSKNGLKVNNRQKKGLFFGDYRTTLEKTYIFISSSSKVANSRLSALVRFARRYDATEKAVEIDGFKGIKFIFVEPEGFFHSAVAIRTKKRLYIFNAVSETENSPHIFRFINSIGFEKDISQESDLNNSGFTKAVAVQASVSGTKPITAPYSGRSSAVSNKLDRSGTRDLQILTKPRPGYTDVARTYNIQGTVMLRITFKSDGTIGTIMPLEKVPFGITRKAIIAASKLKFFPPTRDGVPYSVSKRVQYNFKIY